MHSLLLSGVLLLGTLELATTFNFDTVNLVKEFTVPQKDSQFGYAITMRNVAGKE